jgi:hypothetical protein
MAATLPLPGMSRGGMLSKKAIAGEVWPALPSKPNNRKENV